MIQEISYSINKILVTLLTKDQYRFNMKLASQEVNFILWEELNENKS